MLIYQFYSSFIVGSLLIETPKNIKTIEQLLNSELSFGLDKQPYVGDIFSYAKEDATVELYNKIMKHPERSLMSTHAGIDLLKKGKTSFMNIRPLTNITQSQVMYELLSNELFSARWIRL